MENEIKRYILDNDGYIANFYFGCYGENCIAYEGAVPEGYESLEDWYNNANIRAYKIVDGNLVYDENRDNELQIIYEQEAENNATATHEWVRSQLGTNDSIILDEFSSEVNDNSLVYLEDSGAYKIPQIKVHSETATSTNLKVSNRNLLKNEAVTTNVSGIDITINSDKTITLNGTATSNIEIDLNGTSENTDMLFLIKKEIDYTIGGLVTDTILKLYSYDGTDRTLINSVGNETINLSDSSKITQVVLTIESGKVFDNVTISPQIEIGSTATEYIEHQESDLVTLNLVNNKSTIENELSSYIGGTIIMSDEEVDIDVIYYRYKYLQNEFSNIEANANEISMQVSNVEMNLNNNYSNKDELEQVLEEQKNNITSAYENAIKVSADNTQFNVTQYITQNGVSRLVNNLVTIDVNGIKVAVNTSAFNTLIDNEGFYCRDGDSIVVQMDKDGTLLKNTKLTGITNISDVILLEKYEHETFGVGLAHYWVGD